MTTPETDQNSFKLRSLWQIFRSEWQWWLPGSFLSILIASILLSGWPAGLLPNLSYPYIYAGDGLSASWLTQRAMEGWIFDNIRSGYPFGSNFLDYPVSDAGSFLILKILGLLTGKYYQAINLYILLSFAVVFVSSYCTARAVGLSLPLSLSASFIFSFAPFHFLRLGHLFFLWYFGVPVAFYLLFYFYFNAESISLQKIHPLKLLGIFTGMIILASFGVYYALFEVILLGLAALSAWAKSGRFGTTFPALLAILALLLGVFINIGPSIVNGKINGPNPEVAVRSPMEAEVYGFKLVQLLLPWSGHRNSKLADLANEYAKSYPLINENGTASLGMIGAAGFILLFTILLATLSGRQIDKRLTLLSMAVLLLFLFGTIGGLGSIFAAAISSSIRGWNRISIFIAYGSVVGLLLALQNFFKKHLPSARVGMVFTGLAILLAGVAWYDQTMPACLTCNQQIKTSFENDREFVGKIENSLAPNSAIYQLPYKAFPESLPIYRLYDYYSVIGFLQSTSLRWSYAGMKGREGDLFYRALAQEPVAIQLQIIRQMGFAGIYVDRRGYADNADNLVAQLTELLGSDAQISRADGEITFFRLPGSQASPVNLAGLSPAEIMHKAGYSVGEHGARYSADFLQEIDFRRSAWPSYVSDVRGFSYPEDWGGRWSNANLNKTARLDFASPLPSSFTLVLTAKAFGKNGKQDVIVRVGQQEYQIVLTTDATEIRIPVELGDTQADSISFIPQHPISPRKLGTGDDNRVLGIGFIRLRFEK